MITMRKAHDTRHNVFQGKRLIGYVVHIDNAGIPGGAGWRFLVSIRALANRYPVPAPVFATAEATLSDVIERLS